MIEFNFRMSVEDAENFLYIIKNDEVWYVNIYH